MVVVVNLFIDLDFIYFDIELMKERVDLKKVLEMEIIKEDKILWIV